MKNYLFIFIVCSILNIPISARAQSQTSFKVSTSGIEGLSVYPNPINTDQLYITTKYNLPKTIEIYNVLGNCVITESIIGKSVNISKLSPGLYILKIKENELSATRKLVVR